jgi:hypothetical protein
MPSSVLLLVLVVCDSVRKLKTQDIVSIKPIALKRVNNDGRLKSRLEVSKAKDGLLPGFFLSRDESDSFESEEGSEDVSDLPFRGVQRDTFDIDCIRSILRNGQDLRWIKNALHVRLKIRQIRKLRCCCRCDKLRRRYIILLVIERLLTGLWLLVAILLLRVTIDMRWWLWLVLSNLRHLGHLLDIFYFRLDRYTIVLIELLGNILNVAK